MSLWALGSSSWKKAKISCTRKAGGRGQSGLPRRLWGTWVETAGDWRPSLDRIGMWTDCLQVGRETLITRYVKRMWTAEEEVSFSYRKEDTSSALLETQTVNPSLKVSPACSQLWVFFSLSRRSSALKLYRNSQLKPYQDRLLGLEWGTQLTIHILIYLPVVAPTSPPVSPFWGFQCPRQGREIWTLRVTIFTAAAWEVGGHTHVTGRCHQSVPHLPLHMMGEAVLPTRSHPGFNSTALKMLQLSSELHGALVRICSSSLLTVWWQKCFFHNWAFCS